MDEKNLMKLYRRVVGKAGFKEDKNSEGWMPKLGPDDYRSVIREGESVKDRAVITVSPHDNLYEIGRRLDSYSFKTQSITEPIIRVPQVICQNNIYDRNGRVSASYMIQRVLPDGGRILQNLPLSSTVAEKEEVSRLYWNTIKFFPRVELGFPVYTTGDYFLEQTNKLFAKARECQTTVVRDKTITEKEKDAALVLIFRHSVKVKMKYFFAHLGNTDIVKTNDGLYYIWNAPIVSKPECAGIAYWLWNLAMYSYDLRPKQFLKEIGQWLVTFENYAPKHERRNLELKIWINLLERMLGALLVDIPLRRSPLDICTTSPRLKNVRDNCRELFKLTLSTLQALS